MNIPITPNTGFSNHPTDQMFTNMLPGMGYPAESALRTMIDYANAEFISTSPSNIYLPLGITSFDAFVNTVGRYEEMLDDYCINESRTDHLYRESNLDGKSLAGTYRVSRLEKT
jgi:hypothetical protein